MAVTLGNNPFIKLDSSGRDIQSSSSDMSYRAEYSGTNLIYKGFARPGASTAAAVWQIAKLAYDGSGNILSIMWPQNTFGAASSEYQFIWDNRATYTYS